MRWLYNLTVFLSVDQDKYCIFACFSLIKKKSAFLMSKHDFIHEVFALNLMLGSCRIKWVEGRTNALHDDRLVDIA